MKKILFVIFISCLFICKVNAETCDDKYLVDASKVKVEAVANVEGGLYYKIVISNITPNIYVQVHEDDEDTTTKYTNGSASDGVITIYQWYVYDKVNYVIKVFAEDENCKEPLKVLTVSTNKVNKNYSYEVCKENPEYYKCEAFYEPSTKEDINQTEEEFLEEINKYAEIKNETLTEKIIRLVKEYYLYVLIPFGVISIVYIILIIIYKRKNSEAEK